MAALSGPHDFLTTWKQAYMSRRNHVVSALNAIDGLNCLMPTGAFYVYPDCGDWLGKKTKNGVTLGSDVDITKALLNEAKVALVPGTAFHSAPNFRLSYAADLGTLKEACIRISKFQEHLH